MNAFLVEHGGLGIPTTYYCGPGDWCTNPNHAKKFETALPAAMIATECTERGCISGGYRVIEHAWVDV
jgi:hypothetical protein